MVEKEQSASSFGTFGAAVGGLKQSELPSPGLRKGVELESSLVGESREAT